MIDLWRSCIPPYYRIARRQGFSESRALRYALDQTNRSLMESFE